MLIHKCDFCGKSFNECDDHQGFGLHYNRVGYGSIYDGCNISIDLCCDCFDTLMKEHIEPKLICRKEAIKEN